jgi:hypothetical protein
MPTQPRKKPAESNVASSTLAKRTTSTGEHREVGAIALQRQCDDLKRENEKLRDQLRQQRRAVDTLHASLTARPNCPVSMIESYEGQVVSVQGDEVVVVYEVNEDLVEQTYVRQQFIGEELPQVGQRLAAVVSVAQIEPQAPDASTREDELGEDEAGDKPRDPITGPDVF